METEARKEIPTEGREQVESHAPLNAQKDGEDLGKEKQSAPSKGVTFAAMATPIVEKPSSSAPIRMEDSRMQYGKGGGGIDELIKIMLHSCLDWCKQKNYHSVYLETEDWRGLKEDIKDIPPLRIMKIQCASRVNCVAMCLVNSCKGSNVIFCSREGLPRGLGRILALEGIPHFVVAPGVDAI
nr:uncharacterized protein LOC109147873 [Ipomoea trifida]